MIGTQIGHYKIVGQLGRGGMATVYKAYQVALDRPVALKILQPALAQDDVIVKRFEQEARIAANLYHPNIVTIYDVGQIDGLFYIAMRYIDGENLGNLLRRDSPLDPKRALHIVGQVADALDFAHTKNILHRDVKPGNVMVEGVDVVTLTDFGIARASERTQLTATRMVIGTPEYMSPEQALGEVVDKRSDLYALGVLLYESLGGRPPFSAASTPSLLYLHVHEPPPPLHELRADLPRSISDVLLKALAKSPADRFNSGREMLEAAREAIERPGRAAAMAATEADQPTLAPSPVPIRDIGSRGPGAAPTPIPAAPLGSSGGARSTQTASARTLTPPPVAAPRTAQTRAPAMTPPPGNGVTLGAATLPGVKRSRAWILGPLLVVVALIVVGAFVFLQLRDRGTSTTTTPTVVAVATTAPAEPTAAPQPPTVAPATQVAVAPTAAPAAPTAAPTAVPPTAAPPTAVPATATPAPSQRLQAAQAAIAAGEFDRGIELLMALKQSDPTTPGLDDALYQAHMGYGKALLERNELDASYAQYARALEVRPNDPAALEGQKQVALIGSWNRMEAAWGKDDEAAIAALEEIMQLEPGFRDTRQKLYAMLISKADRLSGAGDREGAYLVLMRAIEVNPDGVEARERLRPYTPTPTPAPVYRPPAQQPSAPRTAPAPAPAPQQPPSYAPVDRGRPAQ